MNSHQNWTDESPVLNLSLSATILVYCRKSLSNQYLQSNLQLPYSVLWPLNGWLGFDIFTQLRYPGHLSGTDSVWSKGMDKTSAGGE